jgi:hypothetical protein
MVGPKTKKVSDLKKKWKVDLKLIGLYVFKATISLKNLIK